MPELPEVETTRRGVEPFVLGRTVERVDVRESRLRWPVPADLPRRLAGVAVRAVERRGKYLLFRTEPGTLMLHLGMSGSLRILRAYQPPLAHEHVDLVMDSGDVLRYTDPRRFGSLHWVGGDPLDHPLLAHLGPEPLGKTFDGDYLYARSRGRTAAVKAFLMDGTIVVGVGNIYANEALFMAGIHPRRAAGRISRPRYLKLAEAVRAVLAAAIEAGGTTLRDFVSGEGSGRPGYFAQSLRVYGREGKPCPRCGQTLRMMQLGQRATYFCPGCQR